MKLFAGYLAATLIGSAVLVTRPDDRYDLIKNYKTWKRVTETPQDMTPRIALACAMQPRWHLDKNPHIDKVFHVYVNKIGEKAMLTKGVPKFPNGTVILKEKYDRESVMKAGSKYTTRFDEAKLKAAKPELRTVMVKRNGAWEYFALDATGKIIKGETKHCASCHTANKENDFVFRPYVAGAPQPRR